MKEYDRNNPFITIENFPIQNFYFPDFTPMLENDIEFFNDVIKKMSEAFRADKPDVIACIDCLGFIFGIPMAQELKCRIALIRKRGKLPRERFTEPYEMCYSKDKALEMNKTAVSKNDRVLIVDDFIASKGTFIAAKNLVERAGGEVIGGCFFGEIPELNPEDSLPTEYKFFSYYKIFLNKNTNKWEVLK